MGLLPPRRSSGRPRYGGYGYGSGYRGIEFGGGYGGYGRGYGYRRGIGPGAAIGLRVAGRAAGAIVANSYGGYGYVRPFRYYGGYGYGPAYRYAPAYGYGYPAYGYGH